MIWKIITAILIILIALVGGASLYLYSNPKTILETNIVKKDFYSSDKNEIDLEFERISAISKQQKGVEDIYVTGWIPEWDVLDGINAIYTRPNVFDSVSPVWFFINSDGTLKKTSQTNGANQIKFFKDNSIELIPSIQEFDSENLSLALNGEGNINKLVNEIVNESVKNNYAGIDLDIESTKLQDKHLLFKFLEELSTELKSKDKKLVFTALPKFSDLNFFAAFPQTVRTQDYGEISKFVDEFRIMTYQYSGPQNSKIGPVQPLEWQEQVIKYAIYDGVPREKLVLGVATYSFDWSEREIVEKINLKNNSPYIKSDELVDVGATLVNNDINKIKTNYEFTENFNEVWGEMILKYNFKSQNRIVVYPNDQSIQMRKQLAADYGIKGVAYWRLGDEGNLKL